MKKKVELKFEVTLDMEKIVEAYPNYKVSFRNERDFIEMISNSMIDGATGGVENTMEKFGYDIKEI